MYKLSSNLLLVGLLFVGQQAFSDTGIKENQVTEGTGGDNAITIAHGCEEKEKPIRAQSVLFPFQNPELIASDNHVIANLGEILDQSSSIGNIDLIRDKSIFNKQNEKYNDTGATIGFYGKNGNLPTNLQGRVPFQFIAPFFNSSTCADILNVEVAIADICVLSKPTIRASKVNLWIPDNSSQYAILGKAQGVEGIGDPAILQIRRNLITNPMSPSCTTTFTVTVRPSASDIDANLGIPGWHY